MLVGLLQFLLLALEFLGQRLRLLEQILRAGIGLNGVEHDADTLGQLIEKRLVRGAEAVEGRQFHHRLDLAFKHDRQHQHVQRIGLAQAGTDRGCSPRGTLVRRIFSFSSAHWPTRPSPSLNRLSTFLRSRWA